MYEKFLADPRSVDPAWHDFFADYKPTERGAPAQTKAKTDTNTVAKPTSNASNASSAPARAPDRTANGQRTAAQAPARQAAPAQPKTQPRTQPKAEPTPPKSEQKTQPKAAPKATPATEAKKPEPDAEDVKPLRGAAAMIAKNMDISLSIPTATSVRAVPAKLLYDNRIVINNRLKRTRGGKVSFTHLIGYALIRAIESYPNMNRHYAEVDGKPTLVTPEHVNLGLAIDLPGKDGQRTLVVASIKDCETMTFTQFWQAYEDLIRKARTGSLKTEDFQGTTISLTNPGTIGTNHSVPRLTAGQGAIIGVGAMEYPAEFQGMNPDALTEMAVSKIITLTSTYDHRIIQGAESGDFLRRLHGLLLGEDGFYDRIFRSLRIPYEPVRWVPDVRTSHEGQIDKEARVIEVIEAYRRNGHLMADTDPLEFKVRSHPDLDIVQHGLTLWDLDRSFPVGGFAGERTMPLRDILGVLRNS